MLLTSTPCTDEWESSNPILVADVGQLPSLLYFMFMRVASELWLELAANGDDSDCLVDLVDAADNAMGGVDDNLDLANALDKHTLLEAGDEGVELMCQQCPVMCTVKSVGGSAIALVNNREACIDRA